MKNTVTQNNEIITQKEFDEDTTRWREEDILKLSNHFHKLDDHNVQFGKQYKRIEKFVMNPDDVQRFKRHITNIESIKLYLALELQTTNKYTSYFILAVYYGGDYEEYFKLIPDPIHTSTDTQNTGGERVPEIFKDMIGINWQEIDNHLINDLFTAEVENSKNRVRVHHYCIGSKIIEYLKSEFYSLDVTGITLYPGVDLNKFSNKKMISFTPTLGFKFSESKNNDHKNVLGFKGILESAPSEIYVEYLRPCPPTCPVK